LSIIKIEIVVPVTSRSIIIFSVPMGAVHLLGFIKTDECTANKQSAISTTSPPIFIQAAGWINCQQRKYILEEVA
jgi:hypothetical protein